MDKTRIKNFAVRTRRKLIEEVTHKAYETGITKETPRGLDIEIFAGGFKVKGWEKGRTFKKYEIKQREKLIQIIQAKGFDQVMEEVAYTWFNRFIALRFMEVNDYLPTGVRVLSSTESGKTEPDLIREALNVDLEVDREIIFRLQDSHDTEDLYKYLLVKQCNQLGKIMPSVFEEIADYTELLLPDRLLAEGSVIRDLVESIEEYDWKIELSDEEKEREEEKGEHGIEIIGWLYQYYISEKKDEVFAGLKQNKKITKENIPAATQLFTPKWIVKYMVENSLGRLWLESHPNEELKAGWKYFLEEAEQEPEVQKELEALKNPNLNPEEIKILDPAMGSGHILVYAFDVLYEIYLSAGYAEREIPRLILEKNLFGLDIDDRAGQLASFALLMKARSKNRRIFKNRPKLNLCAIQESNGILKEAIDYLVDPEEMEIEQVVHREQAEYLINVFNDAKEYGSILDVEEIDFNALEKRIEKIRNGGLTDLFQYPYVDGILEKVPALIQQGRIMSQRYDVVCTNPPYMGRNGMDINLLDFTKDYYPKSKGDLFSVFIEKSFKFAKSYKYISMITMQSWMYLPMFKNLRKFIFKNYQVKSVLHLGSRAFEEIKGEKVKTVAYVAKKIANIKNRPVFVKLIQYDNHNLKHKGFFNKNNYFSSITQNFILNSKKILPSYEINERIMGLVNCKNLSQVVDVKRCLATGKDEWFIRYWPEIVYKKIWFKKHSIKKNDFKWFPVVNGGEFRKWYGNTGDVLNWENNGELIKKYHNQNIIHATLRNLDYFFLESLTYTYTSMGSGKFNARYIGDGFTSLGVGPIIALKKNKIGLLGFLNSRVFSYLYEVMFGKVSTFETGNVGFISFINEHPKSADKMTEEAIQCAKTDWDSFETSWDFQKHPLLTHKGNATTIEKSFTNWSNFAEQQFYQLKQNEEELNRIFIEIYGLQDELTPEVEDKDITISKADRERDIKSFISYAVGCMFGRYSLDEEGLIYAGGDFKEKFLLDNGQWKINTKLGWVDSTIKISTDNVIPIADDDYFEDDILERFIQFMQAAFSSETLEENLDYIAETLGKKNNETSRQAIRRYFLKDFYPNHVKTYKKRPIYWLFESGKQNGFKALIYLHRYDPFIVARVRTDYLHKLQKKYEAEVNHLDILIDSNVSDREKALARKRKENIMKQIQECRTYDQAIAHVANQKIELDLDDGVVTNYAKFQGVEIPQGEGKKPFKADLLAKI
ncbi:BREX-1 system adenine-specific DNA-methyltransferase PglX [Dehalobacterium formicoaceticum]|uniref:BREX-1 system adenine-specific DNA-methyltransferase PglX n=1 Tax=Dehalobacterium formicoaceticum TaxID=51515 RepID=UPI000B80163E|nr:BREX-1 system adenine-specific DNA-methyltransferase PglX [Dehalobacterium formicoaceticum]